MNRILDLQTMVSYDNGGGLEAEQSSSSGHNCVCSTNSAAACFAGDELVAI
jgi:hypothetical protein